MGATGGLFPRGRLLLGVLFLLLLGFHGGVMDEPYENALPDHREEDGDEDVDQQRLRV